MSAAPGSAEPGSGYAGFWLCRVLATRVDSCRVIAPSSFRVANLPEQTRIYNLQKVKPVPGMAKSD